MNNKHSISYQVVLRHFAFWVAYLLYLAMRNGWQDKDEFSFNLDHQYLTTVPFHIILTYVNLYVLMPALYYRQKYFVYVSSLVLSLLIGGLMIRYLSYLIWVPWDRIHEKAMYNENPDFWIPVRIIRNAVEIYPLIALTTLLKLMRNAFHQEKHLREMEKEKFSAELGLLKAQINPHFFFNTLNSLYALTLKNSEKASDIVLRLSDLMHYMLYEACDNKVLLKNEIKHLENYIGIEQMRFADRLELSFQYSGEIDGKMIAPLILLPFVENAFKHGITENSGWITINLNIVENRLFFKVDNSYKQEVIQKKSGLGLSNVKRRLEMIYPGEYDLLLNNGSEVFEVDLKLNL